MKLASLRNGSRDGRLVVVSRDLTSAVDAGSVAPTMQFAVEHWSWVEPGLRVLSDALSENRAGDAFAFDTRQAMAPLPRTHQFVDASAFLNHGNIMERAFNLSVKRPEGVPILVQRQSDDFVGAHDDYPLLGDAENADFEGEYAVIVDDIAMGSTPDQCAQRIRLVTMLNDVSMRAHLTKELQMGFGFIQAKPATAFAPVAVTPDELGEGWADGRIALDMRVHRNAERFGQPNGREMDWSFGELLAYLAYNRNLRAGTILGSGTVSNGDAAKVGSACLAERRALEVIEHGAPRTPWLRSGDLLRFEVFGPRGGSVFGAIEHRFVDARR